MHIISLLIIRRSTKHWLRLVSRASSFTSASNKHYSIALLALKSSRVCEIDRFIYNNLITRDVENSWSIGSESTRSETPFNIKFTIFAKRLIKTKKTGFPSGYIKAKTTGIGFSPTEKSFAGAIRGGLSITRTIRHFRHRATNSRGFRSLDACVYGLIHGFWSRGQRIAVIRRDFARIFRVFSLRLPPELLILALSRIPMVFNFLFRVKDETARRSIGSSKHNIYADLSYFSTFIYKSLVIHVSLTDRYKSCTSSVFYSRFTIDRNYGQNV